MDPLAQIEIQTLMAVSSGDPNLTIGLIDGPIDLNHPAFRRSKIRAAKEYDLTECKNASSIACRHGTFIAGILCASRGLAAPAICPGCTLLVRPIFIDEGLSKNTAQELNNNSVITFPASTPEDLANAIVEVADAGARIINLSLGLTTSSLVKYYKLQEAYDYARKLGVIIVIAAGNQGNIGSTFVLQDEWIIPVAACDEQGLLHPTSNFGPTIGRRGLMGPGVNIRSTSSGGGYAQMSGTSFAAPFITGAIALLWSLFPRLSAANLINAVRRGATSNHPRRSIVPSLLNVKAAYNILKR